MSQKLLTIAITAFNEEKYLNRCVDSVINAFNNKFKDVEIIISNNNSTDNTLIIANEYANKFDNICVVTTLKKGPSVARNACLDIATGKFITFIDGDDYVDANILNLLDIIEQNPTIDVFQNTYFIHKNEEVLSPKVCNEKHFNHTLNKRDFQKYLMLNTGFSSSSSKVVKMSLIRDNNLKYDENFMQMEDMEFGVRVWDKAKTFMFINNAYYHYETRHEGSLTKRISYDRMIQGLMSAYKSVVYLQTSEKENKKFLQFVSLMTYSLIRRYKDLSVAEQGQFLENLKKYKTVLNYPHYFSTKLFYIVFKVFGLKFALKFV